MRQQTSFTQEFFTPFYTSDITVQHDVSMYIQLTNAINMLYRKLHWRAEFSLGAVTLRAPLGTATARPTAVLVQSRIT